MLALHAAWTTDGAGALLVWAEDGDRLSDPPAPGTATAATSEPAARPAPDRRRRRTAPPPHPFAAAFDSVAAVVRAVVPTWAHGGLDPGAAPGAALLRLPGTPAMPEASPDLVTMADPRPRVHARRDRGPWPFLVPAVRLAPAEAAEMLLWADERLPDVVRAGTSLRALGRLGDLALEVVAGGRVLPALVLDEEGTAEARWEPIGYPDDTARLGQLAAALPPAARCVEGAAPPATLAAHALRALVDAHCRAALGATAFSRRRLGPGAPTVDRWVSALGSADAALPGDPADLASCHRVVTEWRAPADATAGSWRLCFRLREPEPTTAEGPDADGVEPWWHIDLLLQATDDPSLLVGAAAVWRAGETLRKAARSIHEPQEVLLAELGRAERVFPELGAVLQQRRPSAFEIDAEGAHRFLSTVAPALEVAGFGVLLPSWWRRPASRLGVRLHAASASASRAAGGGRLTTSGLATVDWQAALGDEVLDLRELRRLAELKAPLVRVRGQWMELRHDEIAQLVAFLEEGRRRRATMSVADVLRTVAGLSTPVPGVQVTGVDADGLLQAMLGDDLESTLVLQGDPPGFTGHLRPYQQRAVAWIELLERAGLGACLADDMGLGKTATVLALLQSERAGARARRSPGPTLVVCPTSVVGNWRAEAERFTPELVVVVHHGASRRRGDALAAHVAGADVVITTYPLVERDRAALSGVSWHRIVLDEAQQVKNPGAKQTRAVRSIPAGRRLALTGTPVENHLGDLWSLMEILNPGLLGTEQSFRERFAVPIERYQAEDAASQLRVLTRPFVLRRLKTDRSIIDDLPDKLEITEHCTLTREQATLYQAVVDEMLERIASAEGIERKGLVLATMLRLKQVCNHPAQFLGDGSAVAGRSGKLERTVEILGAVRDAGEKALVFTQFAEMGAMLQRHLQERLGCRVSFLHGGVPRARRDAMVAEVQSPEGAVPVMVLSLKAGGTGINLTAANHVVHYDRWWNPAVEQQATDRAFRIGQRRDVQVRTLVCAGTVEERIAGMIDAKRALADRVVGTGEAWLTELSTDELASVLRLSAELAAA